MDQSQPRPNPTAPMRKPSMWPNSMSRGAAAPVNSSGSLDVGGGAGRDSSAVEVVEVGVSDVSGGGGGATVVWEDGRGASELESAELL